MTLFFFGAWNPCTTTQPQFWSSSPPPNGNLTAVQPENILQNYPSEFPSFFGGVPFVSFFGGLSKNVSLAHDVLAKKQFAKTNVHKMVM